MILEPGEPLQEQLLVEVNMKASSKVQSLAPLKRDHHLWDQLRIASCHSRRALVAIVLDAHRQYSLLRGLTLLLDRLHLVEQLLDAVQLLVTHALLPGR